MCSSIVAMLWENWRLTRIEAALRLGQGIVLGSAAMLLFDNGATIAFWIILCSNAFIWFSIAKLNGGRFMDGYKPGFPFYLLYSRPVPTVVFVGVTVLYDALSGVVLYLVSAALVGFAFGQPLPLFSVIPWIVASRLGYTCIQWSTPNRIVQWVGSLAVYPPLFILLQHRVGSPPQVELSITEIAVMILIGVVSFILTVAGVARQRRGDFVAVVPRAERSGGYPDWLVSAVPVPVSHYVSDEGTGVVRTQVQRIARTVDWPVDGRRDLPAVHNQHCRRACPPRCRCRADNVRASRAAVLFRGKCIWHSQETRTHVRQRVRGDSAVQHRAAGRCQSARANSLRAGCADRGRRESVGIQFTHGRMGRVDTGRPTSGCEAGVAADAAEDRRCLWGTDGVHTRRAGGRHVRGRSPPGRLARGIHGAPGALLPSCGRCGLAVVALVLAIVLLVWATESGIASEFLLHAVLRATGWIALAAMALTTIYLIWSGFADRALTVRYACGALLISAVIGAARLAEMPANFADLLWLVLPILTVSFLAPWSLSRIRHM